MNARAWACAILFVTTGCATGRAPLSLKVWTPESVHIPNVPFFPDGTNQCGPATVAALVTFWGHPATPAELRSEIYLPNVGGTLPMDLLPAVRARGLSAAVTNGSFDEMKEHLRKGRPVLAYVDMGMGPINWGHYVLVTGFDERGVYVNSGKKQNKRVSYRKMDSLWKRTDRWMLVAHL